MRAFPVADAEFAMSGCCLPHSVSVRTSARLHMGFLDLHGGLGRNFGSLGLALAAPSTILTFHAATDFSATGPDSDRVLALIRQLAPRFNASSGVHVTVVENIPTHAGLGSGTQLVLAVGAGLARLQGKTVSARDIAAMVGRGARSGIGVGAFEQGGLLVDGGRAANSMVPPVVSRMDFPEAWRILLVMDPLAAGVHGDEEREAFRTLPAFPEQVAADLCRRVLMQALPAVAERDLPTFGAAVREIQCRIGDHFAAAQGGRRYTSRPVENALEFLYAEGVSCVGQSSWGPTGFAILESAERAQWALDALRANAASAMLDIRVCAPRNCGSTVTAHAAEVEE